MSIDSRHPTVLDQHDSNLASLVRKFDTSFYLAPTSDIVALMTLEHQTRMTDLLIRLGWETRLATADQKLPDFQQRFKFLVEEVAAYMLFADEARIKYPVEGVSSFTTTFPGRGPRDKRGRLAGVRSEDAHVPVSAELFHLQRCSTSCRAWPWTLFIGGFTRFSRVKRKAYGTRAFRSRTDARFWRSSGTPSPTCRHTT